MVSSSFLRLYYYGQHRWDNYLLDLQEGVDRSTGLQQQSVRAQGEAVEVAREQTEELREQTQQLRELSSGLEEMRGEIRWGFNLVVDRMDQQIELFSRAVEKLDAIHKTLRSPLMTQAKELFDWGEERFHKGLYDKALEAFRHAEQKNEVNFLLQLRIGTLLLEGRNQDSNVVNIPEAEKHLLLAARFAQAEEKTVPNWKVFCSEAYYRAGIASYLIGERHQEAGDTGAMRTCLERAVEYFERAAKLRPELTNSLYSQAKCYALLGKKQETLERFRMLSDRDRRYYATVLEDRDFDEMRGDIERVFKVAIESPGPLCRAAKARLDEATTALNWAKRAKPESMKDRAEVFNLEEYLTGVPRSLGSLQVDIEGLNVKLKETSKKLQELTERLLSSRVASIQSQISSFESRQGGCHASILGLEQKMKETKATGMGWLSGIVTFYALAIATLYAVSIVTQMFAPLVAAIQKSVPREAFGIAFSLIMLGAGVYGGFAGAEIWRNIKNRSLRSEVAQKKREIQDFDHSIAPLQEQLEGVKAELSIFQYWCAGSYIGA